MIQKIKADLSLQIVTAVLLAAFIFIPVGSTSLAQNDAILWLSTNVFALGGSLFMNGLKMLIIPLVIGGLLTGIVGMSDLGKMKNLALGTIGLYLMTTIIALAGALGLSLLFDSVIGFGQVMDLPASGAVEVKDTGGLASMFANVIPENIVVALVENNMLGVIFFVVMFGIAAVQVSEDTRLAVSDAANKFNDIVLRLTTMIMKFAPFGIFFLMANTFIKNGVQTLLPLIGYVAVLLTMLLLHCFITYGAIVKFIGGLNPAMFFSKMREIWLFGFSTGSSSATIPVTMETAEKRMGVQPSSASFTIPLGATINMDGTACMQGAATIFVASIYGIDLTMAALLTVVVTATMASIGTAGVRGAGIVMLSMVFHQVGLPIEGIALLLAVDPILDMIRTAVNLTGDTAVTVAVAKRNNMLDEDVFNTPLEVLQARESAEDSKLANARQAHAQ